MTDGTTRTPAPDELADSRTVPYASYKDTADRLRAAEQEIETLRSQLGGDGQPEDLRALLDAANGELAGMKLARLRDQVVYARGLPLALAERLRGTTEDDLNRDLDDLLRLGFGSAPRPAPNIGAVEVGAVPRTATPGPDSGPGPGYYSPYREGVTQAMAEGRIFVAPER